MRQALAPIAAALALALASCGGDDEPERASAGTGSASGTETAPPAPDPGAAPGMPGPDEAEIRAVVTAAATNREPCEHLTRRYLREFVLDGVTSEDPRAACREAEEGQPTLSDREVRIASVRGEGDRAEVRFAIAGIEQTAVLVRERGRWLIDSLDV